MEQKAFRLVAYYENDNHPQTDITILAHDDRVVYLYYIKRFQDHCVDDTTMDCNENWENAEEDLYSEEDIAYRMLTEEDAEFDIGKRNKKSIVINLAEEMLWNVMGWYCKKHRVNRMDIDITVMIDIVKYCIHNYVPVWFTETTILVL